MKYNHTQFGYLILYITILLTIYFGIIFVVSGFDPIVLIATIVILILLLSFLTLNVCIDKQYLKIKFGYGIFRKKFLLRDIISAKAVKHTWYHGWGIKWWMGIWIFNISGFDLVEITLKNNKKYRIGTDEPKKLEQALNGLEK